MRKFIFVFVSLPLFILPLVFSGCEQTFHHERLEDAIKKICREELEFDEFEAIFNEYGHSNPRVFGKKKQPQENKTSSDQPKQ